MYGNFEMNDSNKYTTTEKCISFVIFSVAYLCLPICTNDQQNGEYKDCLSSSFGNRLGALVIRIQQSFSVFTALRWICLYRAIELMENVDLCQFLFLFSSVCASLIKVPCFSTYLVQFMLHNDGIVYHKHTMNNMASNCHRKSRFLYQRVVVCCLLALFINPIRFAPTTHPKLHFAFGRVNFLRTIYFGSVFFHAN